MNGNDRRGPVGLMSPRRKPFMGTARVSEIPARACGTLMRAHAHQFARTHQPRASKSFARERACAWSLLREATEMHVHT